MLRKVLLPALAFSLMTGTAALAQSEAEADKPAVALKHGEKMRGKIFSRFDQDDDGTVIAEEFGGERLKALQAADTDGDGALSQEELVTYVTKREFERRAERMTRMLDIDGDGTVTLAEFENHQGERFALLDRDDNGELSEDELRRAAEDFRAMHRGGIQDGPRFAMRHRGPGPRFKHMRMHKMAPMMGDEGADGEEMQE
ncbi:EF-hand domain-containing protein [Chelativorans salis]|uniref:EF-hand domain-containing protein n=1 Tax=Chelativorans salis TaxID=2978478 RepID=A0ABT2LL64_9HYPH|nr:EF-hand domain-containing protein [Chelativorans sp. EGI FJ00035]MCT7375167.1 EF-hand domain-containing protein [Chelativorans sp. EGI FJ00035]